MASCSCYVRPYWCILQEEWVHFDALHEFLEVRRRPETLLARLIFELALSKIPDKEFTLELRVLMMTRLSPFHLEVH